LPSASSIIKYGKGLHRYLNIEQSPLILSAYDLETFEDAHIANDSIHVLTGAGKRKQSGAEFAALVKACDVDLVECPSQDIPYYIQTKKREKVTAFTSWWLYFCLKQEKVVRR
jgi:hypothetical protein